MIIKPNAGAMLTIAMLVAASAVLVDLRVAGADELSDLRANQGALQSRIDRLAQPAGAKTGDQPTLDSRPPAAAEGSGSFPRSFLIPGTDTSVRVGGSIDESLHYRPQNGP